MMTQDEFDHEIADQAWEKVYKVNPIVSGKACAREALRLQRESWHKPDPAMEKALHVAQKAVEAYHSAGTMSSETGLPAAAKVIADAIAQAVADARPEGPSDEVMEYARRIVTHPYPAAFLIDLASYVITAEAGR